MAVPLHVQQAQRIAARERNASENPGGFLPAPEPAGSAAAVLVTAEAYTDTKVATEAAARVAGDTAAIAAAEAFATAADATVLSAAEAYALPISYLDTDGTLAANSDTKVASQKAVKTYVTAAVAGAGITALTGDVTASGTGSVTATLATAQPAVHTWALAQTFTVAPIFTDANGSRTALGVAYGTTAGTVAQGNDSRLSDARTPVGTALTSANLWIGNSSNVATAVLMSGDITITDTGVTAIGAGKVTNTMLAGSIAASKLVGSDIATVGTITSGTWNATIIGKAYGGTAEDNSTGGTANTFWARPNGSTGAAAYRTIVAADIPTLNQNTSGSSASCTGNAATATALATARALWGNNFDGTAAITAPPQLSTTTGAAAPQGWTFSGDTDTGCAYVSANTFYLVANGHIAAQIGDSVLDYAMNGSATIWRGDSTGMRGTSAAKILWSSGSTVTVSEDVGIKRNGIGILEINSSTSGTFRDLKLRNLLAAGGNGSYVQTPSMTVANLASAATAGAGARAFVTDATAITFLSTVAGGGSNKVPVVSDGTNWLIG